MSKTTETPTKTLVSFDLAQVLKPEEVEKFELAAKQAGAKTLTEHFLNITLRLPTHKVAA